MSLSFSDDEQSLPYLHAWMYTCMDVYMHGCVHAWMCTCMDVYMHGCVHAWMCTCMDVYMHGCVHALAIEYIYTYVCFIAIIAILHEKYI